MIDPTPRSQQTRCGWQSELYPVGIVMGISGYVMCVWSRGDTLFGASKPTMYDFKSTGGNITSSAMYSM